MAPSSCIELTRAEQVRLLRIARDSIAEGLRSGRPLHIDTAGLTGSLGEPCGSFVTLTRRGLLRGCMGSLIGTAPLAADIAQIAYRSAFHDVRFRPLSAGELDDTLIDVSVLSQPEPLAADSREELFANVRPNVHGLIVEDRGYRGTLLPKVWAKIPDKDRFVTTLLDKAGLPPDHWSDTLHFYAYEAFEFAEADLPLPT